MDEKLLEIPKMPTSRIVRLLGDPYERMTWLYGKNWKTDPRWYGAPRGEAWERIATTVAPIIEALSDALDRRVPTPYASLQHLIRDPKEVSKPRIHPYTGEYITSVPELPEAPRSVPSVSSVTQEVSRPSFSHLYIGARVIWRGFAGHIIEIDTSDRTWYQVNIVFDRPNSYSHGVSPRRWVSMRELVLEPAVPE